MVYPKLFLKKGSHHRFKNGSPWVYSNEVTLDAQAKSLVPGSLVTLCICEEAGGKELGIGYFNPHSLICFRLLTQESKEIDLDFMVKKIKAADDLRQKFFQAPYYRLIYGEADGLPGLIIDRYGDTFSLQANTAGIDLLTPLITQSLQQLFRVDHLVLKNDSPIRMLEGLDLYSKEAIGELTSPTIVIENDIEFVCDLREGQKTGWFYDQRDNRKFVASFAKDKSVLDAYSYIGGFGINCAIHGAKNVTCLDRSELALEYCEKTAQNLKIADRMRFEKNNVYDFFDHYTGDPFDIIVLDPPAFIKSRKDLQVGVKGYTKLLKMALPHVKKDGFVFFASCSHHLTLELFQSVLSQGILLSKRNARILKVVGAGMDHPIHPHLPETQYLKGAFFQVSGFL
jgi:23S rRNA (cytosine1962-C5)-methyltransferase